MKTWISRLDGIEHKTSHWYFAEEYDGKWYVMDKQTTDTWIERHSFLSRKEAKQAIPEIIKFWRREPHDRVTSKDNQNKFRTTRTKYVVSQKGDKWYVVQRMDFFDTAYDEAYETKEAAEKIIPKIRKRWEAQFDFWGDKEWARDEAFFRDFGFYNDRESYMAWMDSHTHEERMEKLNQLSKYGMCDINGEIQYYDHLEYIKEHDNITPITRDEACDMFGDVPDYVTIIEDIEGNYFGSSDKCIGLIV